MKKLSFLLIVASVALYFTGCPSAHDQEYPNYTLPVAASGITTSMTATTNSYTTYHVTINNLVADIGDKFVVAGESIGSTSSVLGANWNIETSSADAGLVGTVDATGTFDITFYGVAPSWGTAADGAAFKIIKLDDGWDAKVLVSATGDNYTVTGATGNDVTIVCDPNN